MVSSEVKCTGFDVPSFFIVGGGVLPCIPMSIIGPLFVAGGVTSDSIIVSL